ncbi:class I SAM-dependent methyltransferase [Nonomuraea salmonea]
MLGAPPPARVVVADDRTKADTAYKLACEGTALLWQGDFHNARQLLTAMGRRCRPAAPGSGFHRHRQAQSQRARTLGMLLIPYDADHVVPLRRAPRRTRGVRGGARPARAARGGPAARAARPDRRPRVAGQGRARARARRPHPPPHHGVFSPIRGEYVDLVAEAPLPADRLAFDVGTGTGVLAAVLARRGVRRVVATDLDERAVACAAENVARLGLAERVEVVRTDLFPPGRAPLVVCNPPWLPAKPVSPLDHAVYDPGGRMLRGFLDGLAEHLEPEGEGWLVLSDLAEHLGLRSRAELLEAFERAGLRVAGRLDVPPRHSRSRDPGDPLHAARAAEVTSLWRLTR